MGVNGDEPLIEGLPDAVYYEIRTILPLSMLTETQKSALKKASKEFIDGKMKKYFESIALLGKKGGE